MSSRPLSMLAVVGDLKAVFTSWPHTQVRFVVESGRVLIEKEIEVKDIDTFEIKNRLRSKLIKGSEEKLKIKKAVK